MLLPFTVRGNISKNSNRNSTGHLKLHATCHHEMRETTKIVSDNANPRAAIDGLCRVAIETIRIASETILARGSQLWMMEFRFEYSSMLIASFPKKGYAFLFFRTT